MFKIMPDPDTPVALVESDLATKPKDSQKAPVNINEALVKLVRSSAPKADWKLNDDIVDRICENLVKGVPLEACAACVYVTPHTLMKWLEKGRDEVCNLTEEQLDSTDNILEILSPYGKLFLRQAQASGQLLADVMEAIHDRMYEQHNEWLLTYLAERLDPQTFNIKYKMEKMKIDAGAVNVGTQNFVHIQFVNGLEGRPAEDSKLILDTLDSLRDKYARKHDESTMRNITPPEDEE